jgi:hypothetical protein
MATEAKGADTRACGRTATRDEKAIPPVVARAWSPCETSMELHGDRRGLPATWTVWAFVAAVGSSAGAGVTGPGDVTQVVHMASYAARPPHYGFPSPLPTGWVCGVRPRPRPMRQTHGGGKSAISAGVGTDVGCGRPRCGRSSCRPVSSSKPVCAAYDAGAGYGEGNLLTLWRCQCASCFPSVTPMLADPGRVADAGDDVVVHMPTTAMCSRQCHALLRLVRQHGAGNHVADGGF